MARRDNAQTWAPTASGQTVLYGVQGHDDGFLVLRQSTALGRKLYAEMGDYREIADSGAKHGVRLVPYVPESNRGTWRMEGETATPTIVLLRNGAEVDRFVLNPAGQCEVPTERKREFVPAVPEA